MKLNDEELRALYETAVRTAGHPDPVGYMARALVFSEADPDYLDVEGKMGFMPVHPDRAIAEVGARDVQSLQSNVAATLAMDILYFDQFQSLEEMIIAFHEGVEVVAEPRSEEMQELIENLPELREKMREIVLPRLATIDDVIKFMTNQPNPPKKQIEAFREILNAIR